ncbi:MAG TPA: aminodeoxychorismate synthase component I [Rhizomicrobium sp.]|nr:aminodeoxychorismate synthase component I [Rhizomicrobium sp.]
MSRFGGFRYAIVANRPDEVPAALAAIEKARRGGFHAAGYFAYELGFLFEPKLVRLLPSQREVPLLWLGVFETTETVDGRVAEALATDVRGRAYAGPLRHQWSEDEYKTRFDRVQRYIADGHIYQANLSFRSRFAFAGDSLALYLKLRERSKAAYGAFINDGERQILSLSPELFFKLSADGELTAKPMKGTIAREIDARSDAAAKATLAASEKDRAENLMIVDLLRNDLGRIAEIGSVSVPELYAVETYPTLHTMVSTVTAMLKPGADVETILRAMFPCGSITGAPKIRAMEIIRELEASPRGIYCGAIGHLAPDGSARFNVAIRTLTICNGNGELGIGGAVVRDSRGGSEYDECLLKARYYDSACRPLELIETLRWSPDEGFVRLDAHLDRMARSAKVFGIRFDSERLVLPGGGAENLRVRIALNEQGEFSCTTAPLGNSPKRWTYVISPKRVQSGDLLARHKTNWREPWDGEAQRLTRETGCDEVIFLNERDEVAEGSRSTVFVKRGGILLTPPPSAGILDGVLRRELINQGKCREATLMPDDLRGEKTYFGNSLRGLIEAVPVKALATA